MFGAALSFVKPAADPGLLIVDGVPVNVTILVWDPLAGCNPIIDNHETTAVPGLPVIKRVAHAVQIGADRDGAVEIAGFVKVAPLAAGLGKVDPESRDAVLIDAFRLGIDLMIAAHREEADTGAVERFGRSGTGGNVGIISVFRKVANLNDKLYPRLDELRVDLIDDRHGDAIGILSCRVGRSRPLCVRHDPEAPGRR